jgi:hypothetical protein
VVTCGDELTLGPLRLTGYTNEMPLPVGSDTVTALLPTATGERLTLPTERPNQRDVALLSRTLLAATDMFTVTASRELGGYVLVTRHDGKSFRRARAPADSDPRQVWRALERGEPEGLVQIDLDGTGWLVAAAPDDPWLEAGIMSGGGALLLTGSILMIVAETELAAWQDECEQVASCAEGERKATPASATRMQSAGQVLAILGGTALTVGGIMLLVETLNAPEPAASLSSIPTPTLSIDPDRGFTGGLSWTF